MLNLAALRFVVVGVAGIVLLFAAYAVASAPTRVASRLGMRGLKRRMAIESDRAQALSGTDPEIRTPLSASSRKRTRSRKPADIGA